MLLSGPILCVLKSLFLWVPCHFVRYMLAGSGVEIASLVLQSTVIPTCCCWWTGTRRVTGCAWAAATPRTTGSKTNSFSALDYQRFGSGFIDSGFSILGFRSGSGFGSKSRVLMTKNRKKIQLKKFILFWSKNSIYLSLSLQKGRPSYRRFLQPSRENIQHFKHEIS